MRASAERRGGSGQLCRHRAARCSFLSRLTKLVATLGIADRDLCAVQVRLVEELALRIPNGVLGIEVSNLDVVDVGRRGASDVLEGVNGGPSGESD